MDRFIDKRVQNKRCTLVCLKSNMDRFIENQEKILQSVTVSLKSNMDRFIVGTRLRFKAD